MLHRLSRSAPRLWRDHQHHLARLLIIMLTSTRVAHAQVFVAQARTVSNIIQTSLLVLAPAALMVAFFGMMWGGHEHQGKFLKVGVGAIGVYLIAAVIALI
ncbi:MAG: hypothetical protein ABJA98_21415 [Acidobacteriota bacterium]